MAIRLDGISNPFGLSIGVSIRLEADVLDSLGVKVVPQPTVSFQSSAPNVVQTTPDGLVTAVGPGDAQIRAQVAGSARYRPDSVGVSVVQPS